MTIARTSDLKGTFSSLSLLLIMLTISGSPAQAKWFSHHGDRHKKVASEEKKGKTMIVSYHQTGGFAATSRGCELDTAKLSEDERKELEKLVKESGILKETSLKKTTPGAADMFFYAFKVTDGGAAHEAMFDDGQLPGSYRPLKDFLSKRAVNQKL